MVAKARIKQRRALRVPMRLSGGHGKGRLHQSAEDSGSVCIAGKGCSSNIRSLSLPKKKADVTSQRLTGRLVRYMLSKLCRSRDRQRGRVVLVVPGSRRGNRHGLDRSTESPSPKAAGGVRTDMGGRPITDDLAALAFSLPQDFAAMTRSI